MIVVYFFSGQNGSESGRVSEKVTRKLLQIKDKLEIVAENYEETNEIVIKGIQIDPITKTRIDRWEVKVRKLAHYGLFLCGGFILYLLITYVFSIEKYKRIITVLCGFLLACSDEFHQLYSAGRTPQIRDVKIDTAGVITGVILATIMVKIIEMIDNKICERKIKND